MSLSANQRLILRRLLSSWGGPDREFLRLAVIKPKMLDTLALMERRGWILMVGDYVEITESGAAAWEADRLNYERYHPWAKSLGVRAIRNSRNASETS